VGLLTIIVLGLAFVMLAPSKARAEGLPKTADSSGFLPIGDIAKAAPGSWTGAYVGAGLGYQVADTNLSLDAHTVPFSGSLLNLDGLSGRGWRYDGRLGFDWQFPNTGLVLGILGGYGAGETEFSVNTDLPLKTGGNILNLNVEQNWYAGARLGYAFNKSLAYVGYAWTQGEMSVSIPAAPTACGTVKGLSCNHDIDGTMFLAGIETMITPQVSLGAEYTLTQYDTASIFSATSGKDSIALNADTDVHAFMVRLNWRPFGK
jgi:opacity protein-like surface antigen